MNAWSLISSSTIRMQGSRVSILLSGQFNPKAAAGRLVGFHSACATQTLHGRGHDRQTDAGPGKFSLGMETFEHSEYAMTEAGIDADAVVLDPDAAPRLAQL